MRIRFSGLGGQGVVVSGVIYGHAAMMAGFDVLQRQSYGSTTRGGVTTSDVTFGRGQIHELEAQDFDVIIALCQEAHDRYRPMLVGTGDGLLLTERSLVDAGEWDEAMGRHLAVPALDVARGELGRQILANIVLLGTLSALVPEVEAKILEAAILDHVPKETGRLNRQAFAAGRGVVESA